MIENSQSNGTTHRPWDAPGVNRRVREAAVLLTEWRRSLRMSVEADPSSAVAIAATGAFLLGGIARSRLGRLTALAAAGYGLKLLLETPKGSKVEGATT